MPYTRHSLVHFTFPSFPCSREVAAYENKTELWFLFTLKLYVGDEPYLNLNALDGFSGCDSIRHHLKIHVLYHSDVLFASCGSSAILVFRSGCPCQHCQLFNLENPVYGVELLV